MAESDKRPRQMPNSLNFRWTEEDIKADLPKRYADAARTCGFSLTGATLAIIRSFTEEIEENGCPTIKRSMRRALSQVESAKGKPK